MARSWGPAHRPPQPSVCPQVALLPTSLLAGSSAPPPAAPSKASTHTLKVRDMLPASTWLPRLPLNRAQLPGKSWRLLQGPTPAAPQSWHTLNSLVFLAVSNTRPHSGTFSGARGHVPAQHGTRWSADKGSQWKQNRPRPRLTQSSLSSLSPAPLPALPPHEDRSSPPGTCFL